MKATCPPPLYRQLPPEPCIIIIFIIPQPEKAVWGQHGGRRAPLYLKVWLGCQMLWPACLPDWLSVTVPRALSFWHDLERAGRTSRGDESGGKSCLPPTQRVSSWLTDGSSTVTYCTSALLWLRVDIWKPVDEMRYAGEKGARHFGLSCR